MAYNTIKIKKYSDVIEEYPALTTTIYPGYLIEVDDAGKVKVHATANGTVLPMFALEDELQGGSIETAFAALDRVQCWIPGRGDVVYAQLADGESVAIGEFLSSDGTGKLRKYDAIASGGVVEAPECIVGVALEAVDMTVSTDPSGRIKVRIK